MKADMNDMEKLLFAKQLMDQTEYANETGLRNLWRIIETGSEEVVNGTSYAPGAFAAWKRIVANRADLFTDALMRDLADRARSGSGNAQRAAQHALESLKRPTARKTSGLRDRAEVLRILFDEALPALPAVTRERVVKISNAYGYGGVVSGNREQMEPLVHRYLEFLGSDPSHLGFKYFNVVDISKLAPDWVELQAVFEPSITPLPMFREVNGYAAPSTASFPAPPTWAPPETPVPMPSEIPIAVANAQAPIRPKRKWWRLW